MVRHVAALLFLLAAVPVGAEPFTWQTDKPEAQGLSSAKLDEFRDGLAKHSTAALLVVRHDKIVYEWYGQGFGPEKRHGTASLAKAVVGGMSLAVAMQDGRVRPDDAACKYIPEWRQDPRKSKITIAQLATHTSGLDDAEAEPRTAHDKLSGWKGEFWKREPTDPFTLSRDTVPVRFAPGQRVSYSNPGMAMLSYAVTAAIQPGEQKDVRSLLRERIYKPIGIADDEWSIGYGKPSRVAGLDLFANWGGAEFTPRAVARIGRLMLREGDWDGRRILDASVVGACLNPPGMPVAGEWQGPASPSPGFGWWSNREAAWKSVPRDTCMGAGAGHQLLIVIPSLDIVVVRNGATLTNVVNDWWSAIEDLVLAPLSAAVLDQPYPPSSVIRAIHFDDESAIVRKAPDSDNWPITWGDDDHLYTAYGDGHGFEPLIKPKLSLGFARVEGGPADFRGFNIRSETGERVGNGVNGVKASGMLMIDGTLYMLARNTKNSTLAWSTDHGVTWTWGFTFDTSFGCPAFLNFGRNYAGARDDFVYVYSQDGPGAYEPYDGIVMARVPKSRISQRGAYEFCTGTGPDGAATWSSEVAKRAHVFHYPGHCERLDVAFNPAIHRYLMALSFGQGKGWGIFDAPEPWGPWTTAYITRDWGQGDTHGYRLPTKWMSPDGKEMYVVFSGRGRPNAESNDAFCLRRFTLELYPKPRAADSPSTRPAASADTAWMRQAKFGVFMHYQYRILLGYSVATKPSFPRTSEMTAQQWNQFVDGFDVKGFAAQMADAKAGWVMFCIDDHYFAWPCSPNKAFDEYTGYKPGEKCSRRDLISDLADALNARGVKLICYFAGLNGYMKEPKVTAGLLDDGNNQTAPSAESRSRRLAILKEYAERFGDRIAGWWFDGMELNSYRDQPADWSTVASIVRSANPHGVIAFSYGGNEHARIRDGVDNYTGGDTWTKQDLKRLTPQRSPAQPGILWHGKIYCGNVYHGQGTSNQFTDDELIEWVKTCNSQGGVCTLDWPFDPKTGLLKDFGFEQLKRVGEAVKGTGPK